MGNFETKYNSMMDAVLENVELAKKYNVTEDWMYENISELF